MHSYIGLFLSFFFAFIAVGPVIADSQNTSSSRSTNADYRNVFTRGSHSDLVLRLQGTPDGINTYSSKEVWWYGSSTVDIDTRTSLVLSWSNHSGNLRASLSPRRTISGARSFTRGSPSDLVLQLQGTPDGINTYSSKEVWWYGSSTVDIDTRTSLVLSWSNHSGNLRASLSPRRTISGARSFTRGSPSDLVLQLQGTPDGINTYSSKEVWWYGSSTVDIDTRTSLVLSWSNHSGNLKVSLRPGNQ